MVNKDVYIDTLLCYERGQTEPGSVAFYDIRPGNGAGLFLQPGACTGLTSFNTYHTINTQQRRTYTHARRIKERVNQGRWKTYDWKMQTADSR